MANFRLGVDPAPPFGLFSVGIHPWDTATLCPTLLGELQEALAHPNCVALGEIGLDRACGVEWQRQLECFETQLLFAKERPVILHCVRCHNDIVKILKTKQLHGVIFHSFVGSRELAQQLSAEGYYLSFGFGALRSPRTVEALRTTPLHRLLLETDTSPLRIEKLYSEVAKIKEIDIELLKEQIENNFNTIFR